MSLASLLDLEYLTCCFLLFSAFPTSLSTVKDPSAYLIIIFAKVVESGAWEAFSLKSEFCPSGVAKLVEHHLVHKKVAS